MGKRKGFNFKARQQNEQKRVSSDLTSITVEVEGLESDRGYDDSNRLVIQATKHIEETGKEPVQAKRKLTRKERKKLEKVLEQKEKKAKRASILESLAAHQASQQEMKQFISISEMQTGKLKRKNVDTGDDLTVNTIAGSNKKKKLETEEVDGNSEGDDSVDTSDISTDEEEEETYVNSDVNKENQPDCERCINAENSASDIEHDTSVDIQISCADTQAVGSNSRNTVRSTRGVWIVSQLPDCVNSEHDGGKLSCAISEKTDTSRTEEKSVNEPLKQSKCDKNAVKENAEIKKSGGDVQRTVYIPVTRQKQIQDSRLKLPILGEEQVIMEAINENPVVIICGETGSGKTTQVPQFLFEAGYAHGGGIIAVTEPRRVAAVSMSKRVATEMSLTAREVSYQIRYEGNVTENTKIKFMTDGVLLKEVQQDFLLSKYSVVIIDEAHERSVYTDILIGLLSRIVPLRQKRGKPLKLVIMSATLRVQDFTENRRLFAVSPPVIKVDARQFPVTVHYNKRTPLDSYLHEAYRKTCKIHQVLPEGGILVFVTGQQEVHTLSKKLKNTFPRNSTASTQEDTTGNKGSRRSDKKRKQNKVELPNISLDNYSISPLDEEDEQDSDTAEVEDIDDASSGLEDTPNIKLTECSRPMYVLPLYSLLSTENQAKVFGPVPEGCRLCVVATNVAETSLTIPGIKYVVDTGKTKVKLYDKVTGVSSFKITWTSKASANQRAGRAGRLGPGHCYRLYSSAVFSEDFEEFSEAEITRRPVEDLVLQMKAMNIEKVVNFPYPTLPDAEQIQTAENLLISLGALTQPRQPKSYRDSMKECLSTITPLGRAMSCFPVLPRYSKMLAMGHQHNLLPYVVIIVSALSVQELFIEDYTITDDNQKEDLIRQRLVHLMEVKRRWAGAGHSLLLGDLMVMLKAVGSSEYEGGTQSFCESHGISYKAMKEVRKLRVQLTNSVNAVMPDAKIIVDPKMVPPSETQANLLRQIVLSGMGDHVARKMPDLSASNSDAKKFRHAYQCPNLEEPVFIHPTSVLYKERPQYIVYQYIHETSKLYMKGITAIEPEWLPLYCRDQVNLSKPLNDPHPSYDTVQDKIVCHMSGTFGNKAWALPVVQMEYPSGIEKIKWFSLFLLDGQIIEGWKRFTPHLLSAPVTMIKTWAKLHPRTESLLKALLAERVDSKESLIKAWKKDPNYLLAALKEWLPEGKHEELSLHWPCL